MDIPPDFGVRPGKPGMPDIPVDYGRVVVINPGLDKGRAVIPDIGAKDKIINDINERERAVNPGLGKDRVVKPGDKFNVEKKTIITVENGGAVFNAGRVFTLPAGSVVNLGGPEDASKTTITFPNGASETVTGSTEFIFNDALTASKADGSRVVMPGGTTYRFNAGVMDVIKNLPTGADLKGIEKGIEGP